MAIQILSPGRSSGYTCDSNSKMSSQIPINHQMPSSHLTSLPTEILSKIISYTSSPTRKSPTKALMPEKTNATLSNEHLTIIPTLLASKRIHQVALSQAYRAPTFNSLSPMERFISQIVEQPSLGRLVRKLDFSSIPSSRRSNPHATTPNILKDLLSRTPLLREIHISKSLANSVDAEVFSILCELPFLEVLQLDSCTISLPNLQRKKISPSITSLTLTNSPPTSSDGDHYNNSDIFWTTLLSSLPNLSTLNASHSTLTSLALLAIPTTAKLTTLDISYCPYLLASEIVTFLSAHPSVSTLSDSNLSQDFGSEAYLFPTETSQILSCLPSSTLKSLNLHSAAIVSEQIPSLARFTGLESLSVGGSLQMSDIENLILGNGLQYTRLASPAPSQEGSDREESKPNPTSPLSLAVLRCKLRRRLNSIVPLANTTPSSEVSKGLQNLRYLDISTMAGREQTRIIESILLSEQYLPKLEVIEVSEQAMGWDENCIGKVVGCVGWQARREGKRTWIARV